MILFSYFRWETLTYYVDIQLPLITPPLFSGCKHTPSITLKRDSNQLKTRLQDWERFFFKQKWVRGTVIKLCLMLNPENYSSHAKVIVYELKYTVSLSLHRVESDFIKPDLRYNCAEINRWIQNLSKCIGIKL